MFRIRIICHADPDLAPDLGSQKCPYGSPDPDPDSYFFIQIRDPDPEGVKVAKDNLYGISLCGSVQIRIQNTLIWSLLSANFSDTLLFFPDVSLPTLLLFILTLIF